MQEGIDNERAQRSVKEKDVCFPVCSPFLLFGILVNGGPDDNGGEGGAGEEIRMSQRRISPLWKNAERC